MANAERKSILTYLGICVLAAAALFVLRTTNAVPDDVVRLPQQALVYYGPEGVTRFAPGLTDAARARAELALGAAAYHGAYAEGPGTGHDTGRGLWTGAHSLDLARQYALADCGADCSILAERLPLHDDGDRPQSAIVTLPELAQRISNGWPFSTGGDILAIGGAGAWGTGHSGGSRSGSSTAIHLALEECNARLQSEQTPTGIDPPACAYMSLRDLDIDNRRPQPPLYPAAYQIGLTDLAPVDDEATRLTRPDGSRSLGLFGPKDLHGVRAGNGDGAGGLVRQGGWPEVASALAIADCQVERRFGTAPCRVTTIRIPDQAVPEGSLAVSASLHDAYLHWQLTGGAGAFAIGPLGSWGTSYNFDTLQEAHQSAADWCHYYSRRGTGAYMLRRALIDMPPCRIVAERDNR